MKIKYLTFLIIISGGLFACKKESNKPGVIGKWQETKLRLYGTDSTGAFLYDTTYLAPFSASDYLQFNNNGTCTISEGHYYYPNELTYPRQPQTVIPITSIMNYTDVGQKFVLIPQRVLLTPGGFDVRDTVLKIDANTLLFHTVAYSFKPGYKTYADAWYTNK